MTNKTEARAVHAAASADHLAVLVRRHPYLSMVAVGTLGVLAGSLFGSRHGRLGVAIAAGFSLHKMLDGAAGPGGLRKHVLALWERAGEAPPRSPDGDEESPARQPPRAAEEVAFH